MGTSLRPLAQLSVLLLVVFMSAAALGQETPGDVDGDWDVDLDDFVIMKEEFDPTPPRLQADFDDDGDVDLDDFIIFKNCSLMCWEADADGDGDVDLDDFVIMKQEFGSVPPPLRADFDDDGDVDLDDFIILKNNFGTVPPDELTLDLGGGVAMDLVRIPAGTFMMGSPLTESDRDDDEGDEGQVQVTLSQDFYMGIYAVTQAQYQAVMGTNPSHFTSSGLTAPVEMVDWYMAVAFCDKLSLLTGRTVALPTEAQWEYACRAGSTTRFYYGDDLDYSLFANYAWYDINSGYETHPVGEKTPNAWGLYDMSGNVWEWCRDWYASDYYAYADDVDPLGPLTGSHRVLRGGGWFTSAPRCRSARRFRRTPDPPLNYSGFRVVVLPGGMD